MSRLQEYLKIKEQIKQLELKAQEVKDSIIAEAGELHEGSNKIEIDGEVLKLKLPMYRKIDNESLKKDYKALPDDIKMALTPEFKLSVAIYKKLSDKSLKLINKYITTTAGQPQIEVE